MSHLIQKENDEYKKLRELINLNIIYKYVCKEWDYEKNKKSPKEYAPFSGKKVFWKCKDNSCGCHKWENSINNRTGNKYICPFCSNRKICVHNNLLAKHFNLCEEWDYEKNEKSPNEYAPCSNKKVWWKCKNNLCGCHNWNAVISNRTGEQKSGCPYCLNLKLCDHNNLFYKHPYLCEEWNYEKNEKSPNEYSPGSKEKVWWKCKKYPLCFHIWEAVIYSRTNEQKSGCPICNVSKGEIIITNYLINHNIEYVPQKKFNGCISKKKLSFDFYLPDHNILIEFDGIQHFQYINFFHKKSTFEYTIIKDNIKLKFCFENKIKLLRITYEEIDFIEEILDIIIHNFIEDLFLYNLTNELSEETRLHYVNQYNNCLK